MVGHFSPQDGKSREFHRSFKQLTGSEKYQCRKARSQRNHLSDCYSARVAMKVKAQGSEKDSLSIEQWII